MTTTKAALLTSLTLGIALFAAPARAQVDYPPQPAPAPPPPETTSTSSSFGGQVLAADLISVVGGGVIAGGTNNGWPLVLSWGLAAPTVHVAHGDYGGAVGSFLLHVFAPTVGAVVGLKLDSSHCGGEDLCGLGGLVLGGVVGMVAATVIDAAALSGGTSESARLASARNKSRTLAMPTLAVDPNGGVVFGVAGRI